MHQVSGRALRLLAELATAEGIDAGRLFADLPFDASTARGWVDWEVYCEALDRVQDAAGGPEGLERLSEGLVFADAVAPFARMLRLVFTAERVYRFINLWIGPMIIPPILNEHEDLGGGRLLVRLRIPPELRDSPAFFHHTVGTMRGGPRLIGLPAAHVELTVAPRDATYRVVVPQAGGLTRRLRRALEVLRSSPRDSAESFVTGMEHLITLRRELARQCREADALRLVAEQGLRQRDALLRGLGHEVRAPMTRVLEAAERLLETELDAEQREQAATARDCARELLEVVQGMAEQGVAPGTSPAAVPTVFEPRAVARQVELLVEHATRARGNVLSVVFGESVPARLRGDGGKIRQVLLNLVDNAVRFTDSGRVEVRVNLASAPGLEPLGLEFRVTDSGIGLPDDARARLFRPFEQAEASTARRFGGTGLGLAISKALVEAMGGTLQAGRGADEGSSFWFVLPVERA